MTCSYSATLFAVAGSLIMGQWAKERHEKYCKEFKDYPQGRRAVVPFLF